MANFIDDSSNVNSPGLKVRAGVSGLVYQQPCPWASVSCRRYIQGRDDEQKARTRDDRPPDLGEMSLAEIVLALKSQLLAPRTSQQRRWKSSFCGTAASSGRGYRKTFFPFAPQRLTYRSRWRQEGFDFARSRGRSRHLTTTFKMRASEHGHAWSLGFASYYQESS